jgi:WD40 repeat protein
VLTLPELDVVFTYGGKGLGVPHASFLKGDEGLVVAPFGTLLHVLDLKKKNRMLSDQYPGGAVLACYWIRNGDGFLTGSSDGRLISWDSTTGRIERTWSEGEAGITALAADGIGNVYVGRSDGTLSLWTSDGTMVRRVVGHDQSVNSLVFSTKLGVVVSGGEEGNVRIWASDLASSTSILTTGGARRLGISDSEELVAIGSSRGSVGVLELTTQRLRGTWMVCEHAMIDVQFLSGGKEIIAADAKGIVRVMSADTGAVARSQAIPASGLASFGIWEAGNQMVYGDHEGNVGFVDLATFIETRKSKVHEGIVLGVVVNPKLKRMVSMGSDSRAVAWPCAP